MTGSNRPLPARGFDEHEFRHRTGRARQMLERRQLAALLVTTEPEVRYFTGFHTPFWHSPTRPWFVIVPRTGDPIAVIPAIGAASMGATWIRDIRTWPAPRPSDDGVSLLAATLREVVARDFDPVGLPMGPETHLRMPLADWRVLRDSLPGVRFVDATDVVKTLRMVKSEAEIAKIAHICAIAGDSFDRIGDIVTPGMTEREAFAAFRVELLRLGADEVPYLVGGTGAALSDIIRPPGARTISRGDLLMFDTGSVWDGYWCDFDRNYAFGRAGDDARRAYETVWRATEAGLARLHPGVTTSDLWRAMAEALPGGEVTNGVGRMGHGVGMQLTEWPSITPTDDTTITENMVLTLEPATQYAPGCVMVHEENVVVRADGAHLLTRRAAPQLPILAG